jgi:hypothetical protein
MIKKIVSLSLCGAVSLFAGQINYSLSQGWNTISVPYQVDFADVVETIGTDNISKIWGKSDGSWVSYDPSAASFLNHLTVLEPGKVYSIQLNNPVLLSFLTTSIENGYYQEVLSYDGIEDAIFRVTLPTGSFDIIAEYASSDKLTQVEFNADNITDEDGNSLPSTSAVVSSGQLRTTSSGIAKLTITNISEEPQTYLIPVRAYYSTSNNKKPTNIWVGAINTDTTEVTIDKDLTLVLDDNTSNVAEILFENEPTNNWSFDTNATQAGVYELDITTDNNDYANPLQYFSVEIDETNGKSVVSQTFTEDGSINVSNVSLDANTSYILKLTPTTLKSDALGYYTIKLNRK